MECGGAVTGRGAGETQDHPRDDADYRSDDPLEKAFDNLAKSDSKYHFPELLLTKGQLLSHIDPRDDASESCFRQSLATARAQGTKLSELRAALHLARLCVVQGRESEARELLAPIYRWFSEGLDMPDLLEAKAILERLGVLA